MNTTTRRTAILAAWCLTTACAGAQPASIQAGAAPQGAVGGPPAGASADGILPTGFGRDVDAQVARVRAATEAFKDLDAAVAAGYPGHVSKCVDNPPVGGMGYHHQDPDLLDGRIELEHPEILVYAPDEDGVYALAGVEYVIPFLDWTGRQPPEVMGQRLEPSVALGIWYRHVWVWRPNPLGLFADWNPDVICPVGGGAGS